MTPYQMHQKLDEICAAMAGAIRTATGRPVTVVCRTASRWTVLGTDTAVQAARPVMVAAGLTLESSHYDPSPDADGDVDTDRYDYWQ